MAEVYAADHELPGGTRGRVALKRMRPSLGCDPSFVQMFMDEARLGMQLSHPGICRVHELLQVEGEYCIAMEYLHGVTLSGLASACARAGRVLPRSIALGIIARACEALHYAHERRDEAGKPLCVIHRDVSPQNLMICDDGTVKVLDFGIAKASDSSHVTHTGSVKGKGSYMSPEQFHGAPLDRRTDIWSLGVVLLEALGAQNPFRRSSLVETAYAIACRPIPKLEDVQPDAPAALCAVVGRALSRERRLRYESAEGLRLALLQAVGPAQVATPESIGAFVRELCGHTLAEREALFDTTALRSGDLELDLEEEAEATKTLSPAVALGSEVRLSPPRLAALRSYARARRSAILASTLSALTTAAVLLAWPSSDAPAVRASVPTLMPEVVISAPRTGAIAQPSSIASRTAAPQATRKMQPVVVPLRKASAVPSSDERAPTRQHPDLAAEKGSRRESRRDDGDRPESRLRARPTGLIFVDAEPYATIYVDGQSLGVTPILGASLPEGRHALRAVTADGRVKELTIDVSADEPLRRRLRW